MPKDVIEMPVLDFKTRLREMDQVQEKLTELQKDEVLVRRIHQRELAMARWNFVMGAALGLLVGLCGACLVR